MQQHDTDVGASEHAIFQDSEKWPSSPGVGEGSVNLKHVGEFLSGSSNHFACPQCSQGRVSEHGVVCVVCDSSSPAGHRPQPVNPPEHGRIDEGAERERKNAAQLDPQGQLDLPFLSEHEGGTPLGGGGPPNR